jgi:hypothetical protein
LPHVAIDRRYRIDIKKAANHLRGFPAYHKKALYDWGEAHKKQKKKKQN